MKRIFTMMVLLTVTISIFAQDYYWYGNKKIFLKRGDERYVLFKNDKGNMLDSSLYIKTGIASDTSLMWGIQKTSVSQTSDIKYISPSFFIEEDSSNMYVTERFYVKLKQKEDYKILVNYAAKNNVEIAEKEILKLWYVLSCTEKSNGNALSMANMFYESALFAAAEPEFINTIRFTCVDDPYFNQQWNLLNTGQQDNNYIGLDINYCNARAITGGVDSIRIAVIDEGIASHFDVSYLYSYSYDAHSGSYPAKVYGAHGTQCAGIIGAHADNNHGITGIAPDCSLISISFKDDTPYSKIATGIEFAVNQNAAVLSNSWIAYSNSLFINNAIEYALTEGRDGKGCVVVFAAGNSYSSPIAYPANYNPDIIAVGAMNASAERASFSNYGEGLDIMAPGVNISTTIPSEPPYQFQGSFCTDFLGTSAACPHVAAVAGLILSVNPDLTQKEVAHIIESTAQKVGSYSYTTQDSHPNGTWNNEMGYGLVDAYAAVSLAQSSLALRDIAIEGPTYGCDSSLFHIRNVPEGATIHWRIGNAFFSPKQYVILGSNSIDSVLLVYEMLSIRGGENGESTKGHISPDPHPGYPILINDTTVTLNATVSLGGLSYTKEKTIYNPSLGAPLVYTSNELTLWPINTSRTFIQTGCSEVADNSIAWEVRHETSSGSTIVYQTTGQFLTYTPTTLGAYSITAINTEKNCSVTTDVKNYEVVASAKGSPKRHMKIENTPTKFLRNGQLYIINESNTYNAEGVRIK